MVGGARGRVGVGLVCLWSIGCSGSSSDDGAEGADGTATDSGVVSVGKADGSSSGASGSTAGEGGQEGGGAGIRFDVGSPTGGDPGCGAGEEGGITFSHIWIANTGEGTVSKINTKTGVEEARYATGDQNNPDPSRTSVNLLGDVAVLNRAGGSVIKIAARESRCVDASGDGVIQTSSGPDDVLPWGQDECVLWSTDLFSGARAVAWDSGNEPGVEGCVSADPDLWVSAMDGSDTVHVWRIDGQTGTADPMELATIAGWDDPQWGGLYGGAIDPGRHFWALGKENAALVRVDGVSFDVQRWNAPDVERFYGIAIDAQGFPWIASEYDDTLFRFNVDTEQFEPQGQTGHGSLRGLAVDEVGDSWIAANNPCALVHYDVSEGAFQDVTLPDCGTPVGVSIDVDGYIWVVDQGSNRAYKVDPVTYDVELQVTGLVAPYTYSDMTGAGLSLVTNPPG